MLKNLMDYVDEYTELGKIHGTSTLNGDYKTGNNAVKKMKKIFEIAACSEDKELFYNTIVRNTTDIHTKSLCYADMLRLNINLKHAVRELEKISNDKSLGIFSFLAGMFLKEWEKGNIKPVDIN